MTSRARLSPARARAAVVKRQQTAIHKARMQFGGRYRRARSIITVMLFIVAFGLLWLLNGAFTAQYLIAHGWTFAYAWSAHLLMSAIELAPALLIPAVRNLPRSGLIIVFLISLPFGIFDVLSSALGVAPWLMFTGLSGWAAYSQDTAGGLIIAFLPERMLVWLFAALINVVQSEE